VLNVGSGRGYSLNDLLRVISEVLGQEPEVEYLPARPLDVPENVLDVSLARTELGWIPNVGLTDGIARVWEGIVAAESGAGSP
jgi:UDP-glucose 4-epimerase